MIQRQDFSTRDLFVSWAASKTVTAGQVMRAGGEAYRYAGVGTAIVDLHKWIPDDVPTALHWGADPTGNVNAIPAVDSMLDYLNSIGGGRCLIPAGTYKWSGGLAMKGLTNVQLEGEGNATILKRDSVNYSVAAIRFYMGTNNRLRRFVIECNGYDGRGILINNTETGVEDVEVNNCPDRPFALNGGGNSTPGLDATGLISDDPGFGAPVFWPQGCYIDNCRATRAGGTAFSQKMIPNTRITNCTARTIYSEGITADFCACGLISGNTLIDVALIDAAAWPDKVNGGFLVESGGGAIGGMGLGSSVDCRVVDNTISGVQTTTPTINSRNKAAICMRGDIGPVLGCVVSGNVIENAKTGIWIRGTVSNDAYVTVQSESFCNILSGNVFSNTGTAAGAGLEPHGDITIDTASTGNVISHNVRLGGTFFANINPVQNTFDGVSYYKKHVSTVANLPPAATIGVGAEGYVTDSNTVVFNAVVAGGGANKIGVRCDGAAWRVC